MSNVAILVVIINTVAISLVYFIDIGWNPCKLWHILKHNMIELDYWEVMSKSTLVSCQWLQGNMYSFVNEESVINSQLLSLQVFVNTWYNYGTCKTRSKKLIKEPWNTCVKEKGQDHDEWAKQRVDIKYCEIE